MASGVSSFLPRFTQKVCLNHPRRERRSDRLPFAWRHDMNDHLMLLHNTEDARPDGTGPKVSF